MRREAALQIMLEATKEELASVNRQLQEEKVVVRGLQTQLNRMRRERDGLRARLERDTAGAETQVGSLSSPSSCNFLQYPSYLDRR